MRPPSPLAVALAVAAVSLVAAAVQIDRDPAYPGVLEASQQALPLVPDADRAPRGSALKPAGRPALVTPRAAVWHAGKNVCAAEAAHCACQAAVASAL